MPSSPEREAESDALLGDGVIALAVPIDVSDPESVQKLFAATVERFDRVNLLFNNAGVSNPPRPFED